MQARIPIEKGVLNPDVRKYTTAEKEIHIAIQMRRDQALVQRFKKKEMDEKITFNRSI